MKRYLLIIFLSITAQHVCAQIMKDPMFQSHVKPLSIGDTLPGTRVPMVLKAGSLYPVELSAYKDRLLILDFWTTTCVSCIAGMPKLDSLQRLFDGRVGILFSTFQEKDEVQKFSLRNPVLQKTNIATVVGDKILGAYFPHLTLPHLVWIYRGVVRAITGSDYATAGNIRDILDGKLVKWPVKQELLNYNYNQPLLTVRANASYAANPARYEALLGYQEGILPRAGITRDSITQIARGYIINLPVINAYYFLWLKIGKLLQLTRPHLLLTPNQLVVEGDDLDKYWFNPDSSGYLDAWQRLHNICLEVSLPDAEARMDDTVVYQHMLQSLDQLLGVTGGFERRNVHCLVLRKIKGQGSTKSGDGAANFIYQLNMQRRNPPVFDDSGFAGKLPIQVADWTDISAINRQLKKYGLILSTEKRDVDLLVIRKHL